MQKKNNDDEDEPFEKPSRLPEETITGGHEEHEELAGAQRHVPEDMACNLRQEAAEPVRSPAADPVFRKTELRDKPPWIQSKEPPIRQMELLELWSPGTEIPYQEFENALRQLTLAIAKRQQALGKSIDRQADDIHDRLDLLEEKIELALDRLDRRIMHLEKERDT